LAKAQANAAIKLNYGISGATGKQVFMKNPPEKNLIGNGVDEKSASLAVKEQLAKVAKDNNFDVGNAVLLPSKTIKGMQEYEVVVYNDGIPDVIRGSNNLPIKIVFDQNHAKDMAKKEQKKDSAEATNRKAKAKTDYERLQKLKELQSEYEFNNPEMSR
jgi:hypothetical protein